MAGLGFLPSPGATSGVSCSLMRFSPRSSGDRAAASGAVRAGSNPAEGAVAVGCLEMAARCHAASASIKAVFVKAVAQAAGCSAKAAA